MDINKAKNIISIIFLGALGSGLWNLAGEPTAGFLYRALSSIGGRFSLAYGNSMNAGIGSGGWDDRGSVMFMLTFIFAFSIYSVRFLLMKLGNRYLKLTIAIVFFLFAVSFSYKAIYSHKLTLYFNRNIEILAPYVENAEILKARSLYRQIDDLKSFNKAQDNIIALSGKTGIVISKFGP